MMRNSGVNLTFFEAGIIVTVWFLPKEKMLKWLQNFYFHFYGTVQTSTAV